MVVMSTQIRNAFVRVSDPAIAVRDYPPSVIRYPLFVLMGCSAAAALAGLVMMLLLVTTTSAHAERVKDLASVAGVRGNQLVGYGLIVGLDGTGDQTSQ